MLDTKHNNMDLEMSLHRLNIINRTVLFKAHIRTIRTRNKALGTSDQKSSPHTNILPKSIENDSMKACYVRSKEIYAQITKLQEFLIENKNVYLSHKTNLLDDTSNLMNEKEKEKIDIETQKIIKLIKSRINDLKRLVESHEKIYTDQVFEHYSNVVDYTDGYLKKVIAMYITMKQENERKKDKYLNMFKLSHEKKEKLIEHETPSCNVSFDKASLIEEIEKHELDENEYGELSAEELQTFNSENDSLFKHLTNLTEEVCIEL